MANKHLEKSVRQDIYEKIRDDITFGRLMSGERLTEKKLSDLYKVSRSPIREALRQLESEGLISFERNKGIEVAKLSAKQVEEIYDLRELLEGFAVRTAIAKMTKRDIAYLEDLHKKLIKAAQSKDTQAWLHNNALFHGFFRDRADNENLCQLIIMLKRRIYRYQYMSVSYPRFFETYIEHHAALIEACRNKDVALAERTMKIHMRKVKDVIAGSLAAGNRDLLI
ncbi:MAG: putative HTH-type transcriptional regulator YdfH [Syntrophaceae bacterium PtaU1.Bin231]|nr:MAG: putative HTH-type transcriptional regulator YdfH [Syntrophaceae bacterium PtaU1.Bin231]HOG18461.1 GntR family transcriptional regulator [Syntrophales bacterium]